jgi:hypothetical protein
VEKEIRMRQKKNKKVIRKRQESYPEEVGKG